MSGKDISYKDIEVLFEDNHVLVAVKPVGVLSQADDSEGIDMLTLLKEYIKVKYNKPGNVYLGLLHRLDRPVSGVMVFAKTSKCASRISEQIRSRKVVKRYYAVVEGIPERREALLKHMYVKNKEMNLARIYEPSKAPSDAKEVALEYKVTGTAEYKGRKVSLVDINLHTGRSHQIRSQMAFIGHPLLGDARYGTGLFKGDIALKSYCLGFNHPISGEKMFFEIGKGDVPPFNLFEEQI